MEKVKLIVFTELIALFVLVVGHLLSYLAGLPFSLLMYPVVLGIVLVCMLLVIFILAPFAEWFFDL